MTSPWIAVAAAVAWSAGCGFVASRALAGRPRGALPHDRLFMVAAILSLGLAPWISLVVYLADDGRSVTGGLVNVAVAAVLFLASVRASRQHLPAGDDAPSATPFRQKSAALMALTLLVVYAVYFAMTWHDPALVVPMFLGSAVLVAVVATVGQTLLALFHAPVSEADAPGDERDREAERYGIRNAYLVLALGIWAVPAVCVLQSPLWAIANVAFLFAVLAEIVRYVSLVRYYRLGEA